MSSDIVIVLTTLGASTDASTFANTLVDEQLAACVNVLPPMISTYRWKGRIEHEGEQQVIMKTTADRVAALEARVKQLHPYETPEFLVLPVSGGGAAYLSWIRDAVTK